MVDKILLTGMVFYGYHGALPEERTRGQPFVVDVELGCDLRDACRSDDLSKTVDYREVYRKVRGVVEERQFSLLERLAEEIAQNLLALQRVETVRVRVHKPRVNLGGILEDVAVEIHRRTPPNAL